MKGLRHQSGKAFSGTTGSGPSTVLESKAPDPHDTISSSSLGVDTTQMRSSLNSEAVDEKWRALENDGGPVQDRDWRT